jgi:hypothetical protein
MRAMPLRLRLDVAWPVCLLVTALACGAHAQAAEPSKDETTEGVDPDKRAHAKELANAGMGLIKSGRIDAGVAKLREALALVPVPTLALATARAMVGAGRMVAAVDAYRETIDMKGPGWLKGLSRIKQEHAQRQAADELAALLARVPKVRLTVVGLEAERVLVDGKQRDAGELEKGMLLDPGIHVFEASAGEAVARKEVRLDEGQAISVALQLTEASEPAPPPEPEPQQEPPADSADTNLMQIGAYAAFGLTAAALGATIGTWVTARGIADDIEGSCVDDSCDPSALGVDGMDDLDSYQTLRTTTIALGVVTGVMAAAGVTLFLLAPSSDDPSSEGDTASLRSLGQLSLRLGPMHAGIDARF